MGADANITQELNLVAALARKARKGDAKAFDKLVDIFWGDIYRMVCYRTGSTMDAEDISQEVFVKAFSAIGGLGEAASFKSWLYSIAMNLVRDHYRRRGVRSIMSPLGEAEANTPEPDSPAGDDRAVDGVFKGQFWTKVNDFCAGLAQGEREAFTMRFIDGLSIRETAQALDRSESAVKTQLYRAVAKFKGDKQLLQVLRGEA